MDFSFPKHNKVGILTGCDLIFFYYDIGLENLQGSPIVYDWDTVVSEFKSQLDIESCYSKEIPKECKENQIRFTVSNSKDLDNGFKSVAFFRHLRNAFAHYHITRDGDDFIISDYSNEKTNNRCTMAGRVNAELLRKFCFRFFALLEQMVEEKESQANKS